MPLHLPPPPPAAERTVRAALRSPTSRPPHPLHLHRDALRPTRGLPVHRLAPVDAPHEPARARLTGWRFLLESGGRAVGAAETRLTPDGWAFSHFREGPYVASSARALRTAEALDQPFQPRLLSVPELYMLTLWLHAETDADPAAGHPLERDLLVPLAPAPPGIAADRAIAPGSLLPLLTRRLTPAMLAG